MWIGGGAGLRSGRGGGPCATDERDRVLDRDLATEAADAQVVDAAAARRDRQADEDHALETTAGRVAPHYPQEGLHAPAGHTCACANSSKGAPIVSAASNTKHVHTSCCARRARTDVGRADGVSPPHGLAPSRRRSRAYGHAHGSAGALATEPHTAAPCSLFVLSATIPRLQHEAVAHRRAGGLGQEETGRACR